MRHQFNNKFFETLSRLFKELIAITYIFKIIILTILGLYYYISIGSIVYYTKNRKNFLIKQMSNVYSSLSFIILAPFIKFSIQWY